MGSQFMQNFMQGWQMGQGRNENQRRNQELEMERQRQQQMMAQRAEEFALRKEEFAAQKKALAAAEAQHKVDAAKEAYELRSKAQSLQNLPPPTAQDIGVPQQGPEFGGPMVSEINVPQPTMDIPNPQEGQAPIPMPVLTGRQQKETAARQWVEDLLKLKQESEAKRAPVLPESAKAEAWKRQGDGTYVNVFTGEVKGKPEPSGGSGGAGISPNQEAALVDKLAKNWQALSKDVTTMRRQISIMDSGLAAAKRGDLAAGSQAVLVTFQKILDPTSVVRESEYARSAAGQALLARIEGSFEQLQKGGAGVPVSELEKFAVLAKEFVDKSSAGLGGERDRIGKIADRYKIPKDLIFSEDVLPSGAAPKATHKWSPQGGIIPIGGK